MTPKLKLTYWASPGRGETTRLLLEYGKIPFEDTFVAYDAWPAMKPTTPFGQIPTLEIDGKFVLAQSGAIERYAANLVGLYPKDPIDAAKTEMVYAQFAELFILIAGTMSIKDSEERLKARQALLEGRFGQVLKDLEKLLATWEGPFVLGPQLSWVDVHMFSVLSMLGVGLIDGMPKDLINSYPTLKQLRNAVAHVPSIAAHYADTTDPNRLSYKPDA